MAPLAVATVGPFILLRSTMTLFPRRCTEHTLLALAAIIGTTQVAAAETPLGAFECTVSQTAQSEFTDRIRRFSARNAFEIEVATSASGTTTIHIWRQDLMAIAENSASPDTFQVRVYSGNPQSLPANSMTHRVLHDLRRAAAAVVDCRL